MVESPYDNIKIRISVIAKGDRGHATNKKVTWGWLKERLANPVRDPKHTLPQYHAMHIDEQNKVKDVGSFVGGPCRDGIRKGNALIERSIVTLDIDSAKPRQIEMLRLGISEVCGYEFFASTTRKHTSEKPRWRIAFPLSRPLNIEEYAPVSRILASKLFATVSESMDASDDVSYRPAQVMYWPSVCKDADFDTIDNRGDLLDPDKFLESVPYDWTDWTKLPISEARGAKRPSSSKKAEDPRTKRGIVGAFCRAYDVPAAMEAFIPGTYTVGDDNSTKPRYTYTAGSSSNGAVVEDDGLFLYSHHGTDPCSDKLVNAFDMVRIHLYGDLDIDTPESAAPTEYPSYKEMISLCQGDSAVQAEFDNTALDFSDESEEYGVSDIDVAHPKKKKQKQPVEQDDEDDEEEPVTDEPEMSILDQSSYPAPDFPVDVLGPFWGPKVTQWSKDAASSVDFTAISMLTAAASTIGNSRWVWVKRGWTEPCVIWSALIGPPSSNKSPSLKPVSDILWALQTSWKPDYDAEMRMWESDKKRAAMLKKRWESEVEGFVGVPDHAPDKPAEAEEPVAPVRRLAMVGDTTVEALMRLLQGNVRGLLNFRDEMSGWFNNLTRYNNGTDRPIWLEAYGGRAYTMTRVKDEGRQIEVKNFSVSILGGVQPDKLLGFVNSDDDGMQARFIYAWPEVKINKPSDNDDDFAFDDEGEEDDSSAYMAFKKLSELDMDPDEYSILRPVVIRMTRKARIAFHKWSQNRKYRESTVGGLLMGAYGKADGLVARLALVLEHLWWAQDVMSSEDPPENVSAKAVRAAIRLREEYIKPMQIRALGHANRTKDEEDAVKLAKWILETKTEKLTFHDVTRTAKIPGINRNNPKQAMEAINFLVNAGWLSVAKDEIRKDRGRPSKVYKVDKRVFRSRG